MPGLFNPVGGANQPGFPAIVLVHQVVGGRHPEGIGGTSHPLGVFTVEGGDFQVCVGLIAHKPHIAAQQDVGGRGLLTLAKFGAGRGFQEAGEHLPDAAASNLVRASAHIEHINLPRLRVAQHSPAQRRPQVGVAGHG